MRRLLLTAGLLFILLAGLFTVRFGSALSQEEDHVPILASISKLEFADSRLEQYATTDKHRKYVSMNTGASRFDVIKDTMKKTGWDYKEQMGAGLAFERGGQTIVVETRQYSKHYMLWNIPNDASS